MYKEGIISLFYLILEMEYFEPLSEFEEHFISGISPNANLNFLDASIVYLREAVFRPIVERLQQGSGHIIVGSNMLGISPNSTNISIWFTRLHR